MFCRAKESQALMIRNLLLPIPQRRGEEERACDKHSFFHLVPPDFLSFCLGEVQNPGTIKLSKRFATGCTGEGFRL